MAHSDRDSSTPRPWARQLAWALFSVAAPLFAAAAFLAFEAARGAAHGFSYELALAALFALVLPLAVVAGARRGAGWSGPASILFTLAAAAIGALFFFLAGCASWLA